MPMALSCCCQQFVCHPELLQPPHCWGGPSPPRAVSARSAAPRTGTFAFHLLSGGFLSAHCPEPLPTVPVCCFLATQGPVLFFRRLSGALDGQPEGELCCQGLERGWEQWEFLLGGEVEASQQSVCCVQLWKALWDARWWQRAQALALLLWQSPSPRAEGWGCTAWVSLSSLPT